MSQRVFTLIELVIALAVIGVAVGGVLFFQSSAEGRRKALAAAQGMSVLVGKVKSSSSQSGSYAHLTLANLVGGWLCRMAMACQWFKRAGCMGQYDELQH